MHAPTHRKVRGVEGREGQQGQQKKPRRSRGKRMTKRLLLGANKANK